MRKRVFVFGLLVDGLASVLLLGFLTKVTRKSSTIVEMHCIPIYKNVSRLVDV